MHETLYLPSIEKYAILMCLNCVLIFELRQIEEKAWKGRSLASNPFRVYYAPDRN